jgi:GAF domain-containing protein
MSCPTPENEKARLNTLRGYKILDTKPEERFDDLARLAANLCGAPIALISLVDEDRQWFKSKCGLEVSETPRVQAFCAHAIMSEELFVIPDALRDSRFADNPLVLGEPHIRFYAGAPLVAPNGHILGTLCVVDQIPRELSPHQLEALRILARQVMAQIELGRNLQDLRASLDARDALEDDMAKLIQDFQQATTTIKTLSGLLPVCPWCKKVRNDQGYWDQVEAFITTRTGVDTTSAICPECFDKHFGNLRKPDKPLR